MPSDNWLEMCFVCVSWAPDIHVQHRWFTSQVELYLMFEWGANSAFLHFFLFMNRELYEAEMQLYAKPEGGLCLCEEGSSQKLKSSK